MHMKTIGSLALALALTLGCGAAFAQGATKNGKPLTAQQEKMKTCNADATTKKLSGDARKTFMKTCLSGTAAAPAAAPAIAAPIAKQTQQEKMKTCNADAATKKLSGDARKSFMSTCLSAH
jgi:hypothetical protein